MPKAQTYIPIGRLMDRVDDEYSTVADSIVKLQRDGTAYPERLQTLADKQTEAFVELAQHYLPDLSHRMLGTKCAIRSVKFPVKGRPLSNASGLSSGC